MADEFVIIPSKESDYNQIADLSRTSRSGKLFKKHILSRGPLIHPTTGKTINIDDEFIATLKKNFDDKVCDIVQVPLANDRNEHTEDPSRNIGEVVELQDDGDKIYAVIDVRDEDAAKKLGHTLLGASAMLHLNYTQTSTGKKVGPTLLHSCVTNRPYITNLDDYEEIVSATNSSDINNGVVLTAPEDSGADEVPEIVETKTSLDVDTEMDAPKMDDDKFWTRFKTELAQIMGVKEKSAPPEAEEPVEPVAEAEKEEEISIETKEIEMAELSKEELISQLKEHGIDVTALQASVEGAEDTEKKLEEATALSNTLSEEVEGLKAEKEKAEKEIKDVADALSTSGVLKLTNVDEDIVGAVSELAQGQLALTRLVDDLRKESAEREVHQLVTDGYIVPAQEEAMVELKLTNTDMFDRLVPDKPLIKMEEESGSEPHKGEKHENDVDAAIAAFTAPDGPLGRIAKTRK